MKLINTLVLAAVLGFAMACSPVTSSPTKVTNTILQYKIKEAFRLWESRSANVSSNFYDEYETWIETGLRYNYGILSDIASIEILENAVGEKIFLSDTHKDGLNFYATQSFGYYNPDFLTKAKTVIAYSLDNDNNFKRLGKYVYDRQLKHIARTYYDSYVFLQANEAFAKNVQSDYELAMKQGSNAGDFIQGAFSAFANTKEELGEDWYVANTAPGFWIRRRIDGTANQIFDILTIVMQALDAEALN